MNLFEHPLRLEKTLCRRLPAGCLGIALVVMAWAPLAIARPKPPSNGSYVTATGGAGRGCGGQAITSEDNQAVASGGDQAIASGGNQATITGLIPTERLDGGSTLSPNLTTGGYTTQAQPSFWFHVPFGTETGANGAETGVELEFVLQDDMDEDVYRKDLTAPRQAGLVQVMLPHDGPKLSIGQRYRWFLKAKLDCLDEKGNKLPQALQESKGWIERYPPEAALASQLESAPLKQQVQLYQGAGYWFDALDRLAVLRRETPSNVALDEDWDQLLGLYGIAKAVAQADFTDCCEAVVNEASVEAATASDWDAALEWELELGQ